VILGHIRCRLQQQFQLNIESYTIFQRRLPEARFRVESFPDTHDTSQLQRLTGVVQLKQADIKRLCCASSEKTTWQSPSFEFIIPSQTSKTHIVLKTAQDEDMGLISAFPRQLVQEYERDPSGKVSGDNVSVLADSE
jgi:hypothetical protein